MSSSLPRPDAPASTTTSSTQPRKETPRFWSNQLLMSRIFDDGKCRKDSTRSWADRLSPGRLFGESKGDAAVILQRQPLVKSNTVVPEPNSSHWAFHRLNRADGPLQAEVAVTTEHQHLNPLDSAAVAIWAKAAHLALRDALDPVDDNGNTPGHQSGSGGLSQRLFIVQDSEFEFYLPLPPNVDLVVPPTPRSPRPGATGPAVPCNRPSPTAIPPPPSVT
ncbi:hypothetical protein VOLCADRAFT_90714 [Volvox carteri f. nagariensis]|uniref:Uncharacterized protein n=1 Tax=Volvox carteri f. nagariensis TaxID=3068 RepID=D8TVJ0_VOLCA|nr:uncharacterized protein VOLCADRAFT_90714 [Volvox carteri f. nagariensis]EFJ48587.1 hypothetical protein VOLCADRAFT_90714 [Volvox carteri f. nagariensis]|eukprot:XP_002950386.1 hypothetical protein VOLCADRAFT_90714 [Volvox carteri f. nagariensis]